MENIISDFIRINVYDKSPMQTIQYQFKKLMPLWKKQKYLRTCSEPGGKQWQHRVWGLEYYAA